MKLVKLSLIAAMATGIMATASSAAPLDEVIKDVDVSGYVRLRFTNDSHDAKGVDNDNSSSWNFKGQVNLKTMIDDNFYSVVGVRYNDTDNSRGVSEANDDDFDLNRAYIGYTVGNTTFQLGRQDVGAFFTDDMYGTGAKILNTDIEGLTLAALWMDALEADGDITANGLTFGDLTDDIRDDLGVVGKDFDDTKIIQALTGKSVIDHDLYGAAIIGSYDPVNFQLWYAMLEDVTDLFAAELALNFDVDQDVDINLKGQYGFSDFDGKFKEDTLNLIGDGQFYAGELSTTIYGVDIAGGYVNFSADKDKLSLVSLEDQGSFLSPGEELLNYRLFAGKNNFWYVTAGFTIPDTKFKISADYLNGENKYNGALKSENLKDKSDMSEVVARINYAHSDKLNFKAWYSHVERDVNYLGGNEEDYKNDRIRFEAKYSF